MTDLKKKYAAIDYKVSSAQAEGGGEPAKRKDKTYVGGEDILKPLKYDAPTDDELKEVAVATYKTAKEERIKSAEDNAENKKKSLYESIIAQNELAQKRADNAEKDFARAEGNLEDQTLRRGIQRSSAVIDGLKGLEKERLATLGKIDDDKKKYIDKLNAEILDLESDLGKEISSINEKYADAVRVRLNELKNERDKKVEEVVKYNNKLDLFYPAKYYEENDDGNSDKSMDEVNVDASKIKERYRERIDEVLRDYTEIDDPKEALELFETNDSVKRYLGKYYGYVRNLLLNYAEKEE